MAARCGVGVLLVALLTLGPLVGHARMPASAAAAPLPAHLEALTGTASCSGRGCHGALEPSDGKVRRNEYTLWLAHDKHANAYQTLFAPRSRNIARNLDEKHPATGKWLEAHENDRCLACHTPGLTRDTWPALASAGAPHGLKEELFFGVGCETCHGPAKNWLVEHTEVAWKDRKDKARSGIKDINDPEQLAKACVGCHVGAPPDPTQGLPLRDVNHDLIAAGHPRLNFELTAYLADMPAHADRKAQKRSPAFEARAWALGQLLSAEAALRLLAYRAGHAEDIDVTQRTPWPEFAEYDCFACHHDLQAKSWRQEADHLRRHPLGSMPWGTWYTSPRLTKAALAAKSDADQGPLAELRRLMQQPLSPSFDAARQAEKAAQQVHAWLQTARAATYSDAKALGEFKQLATEEALAALDWDGAAQLFLALAARSESDPKLRQEILSLRRMNALRFPRSDGKNGYDSPRGFTPKLFRDQLRDILKSVDKGSK